MSLPPIIEQMLLPEFYDHPVTKPIQLLQTHISFVLLTGSYAYKVKKPMNFGFLDFSTLEKRKYFCEEELRLNRRLAPDLYLSVLPIIETDGKYHFDKTGTGTPVEYAIAMPEFAQEDLLIEMFTSGRLTADHVKQIGEQLAAFHQNALTNDHINSFGTMESVRAVANDNYASTESYIGIAQTQAQLDQTRNYTEQFFVENAALFSDRITKGKVRECHGDVHLKNICLYQDQIQIFDCIEFNEPFRNSDVLYDAAFLLMDLQARGRKDLANIFLNTYLERTGDYEGAVLLPLHCSMRAYIRAKVTQAAARVREGTALSRALDEAAVFPPMLIAMVASGEAGGVLGATLTRAADDQARDLNALVAALVALVEPAVLLLMGGIVMLLVLSILLPIVNLNNLVN